MSARADRFVAVAIAAIGFLWLAYPPLFASNERLLADLVDDAFYYFQIARNVTEGHGFSFDGVHASNGFQPGWQLLMVAVFELVQGTFEPVRVALILQAALVAAALALLYGGLRRRVGVAAALLAPMLVISLPGVQMAFASGMESGLLIFALVLGWRAYQRTVDRDYDTPSLLVLGFACALTTAARLEAGVMYRMASWVGANAPEDALIGSFNSGILGYTVERRVINLDGLANSRSYFDEVLRGDGFGEYLRDEEVDWLIDRRCSDGSNLRWYLSLVSAPELFDAFEPVATPGLTPDPGRCPIGVWRIDLGAAPI